MAKSSLVQVEGLDTLARSFSTLGDALPIAMQAALDDIAEEAVVAMAPRFNASIEGGPVPFTMIVPKSKRSSVVTSTRRKAPKGEPEASVQVQRLQSAYLKFHLDDASGSKETERPAGDVGVASAFNLNANMKNLGRWQGINVIPQGNLPRRSVRKLVRRARTNKDVRKDNEDRSRRSVAEKLGLAETESQVDAIMSAKRNVEHVPLREPLFLAACLSSRLAAPLLQADGLPQFHDLPLHLVDLPAFQDERTFQLVLVGLVSSVADLIMACRSGQQCFHCLADKPKAW